MSTNKFQHPEDEQFFVDLLSNGDLDKFRTKYIHFFDFRDPKIKRKELDVAKVKKFLSEMDNTCQLKISPDCNDDLGLEVEHLIPISSNKLNVKIRGMKRRKVKIDGEWKIKKPPTQSFGSNHIDNLVLACKKCNSMKKHRLIDEFPKLVELLKEKVG